MNVFSNWSLRAKILVAVFGITAMCCIPLSLFVYSKSMDESIEDAEEEASILVRRSSKMFLVSTRKFHKQFAAAGGDRAKKKEILDEWTKIILAIDRAVTADFGVDRPRVVLTGSESVYGYPPLGSELDIDEGFELRAAKAFVGGEKSYHELDGEIYRLARPLWSRDHPGCAECHFGNIEGVDADMSRQVLLGSVNAYIPMTGLRNRARSDALLSVFVAIIMFSICGALLYVLLRYWVITPVRACMNSAVALSRQDFDTRCPVRQEDELGNLAAALNRSIDNTRNLLEDKVFFYESILGTVPNAILVLNEDKTVAYANAAAARYANCTCEGAVGVPCGALALDWCHVDDCLVELDGSDGSERTESVTTEEPGTGRVRELTVKTSVMRNRFGEKTGYVETIYDVTEEVEMKTRLQRSQKLESIGQLTSGIAHEFNNLLQVILGYSHMIREAAPENGRCLETTDDLEQAVEHAMRLVRRMLAFSRKEQHSEQEPIELNGLVKGAIEMLSVMLGKRIAVSFRPLDETHRVSADAGQIEQVLVNLCLNARDAMPDGGEIDIALSLPPESDPWVHARKEDDVPHAWVCLSVSDTGEGIPEDVRPHVFDPFFTTKESGKGTGLGPIRRLRNR